MKVDAHRTKYLWRTKFPWLMVMYIIMIGVVRGLLAGKESQFSMNILMFFGLFSYVFIFVFYVYGVKPEELEDWHQRYKKL
jgi:amino acid permease